MINFEKSNVVQWCIRGVNLLNILGFFWVILGWIWYTESRLLTYGGLYLFFTTWVFEVVLERRWKQWSWNNTKVYFIVMLVLFFLGLIYAPWDGDTYFKRMLEHRLGLAGFGLVGLLGLNRYYNLKMVLYYLIVLSMVMIGYILIKVGFIEFLTNPARADLLSYYRSQYVNAHMTFDFFLTISLVGIWYLIFRAPTRPRWWITMFLVVSAVCIVITVLMSDGRSGYLAMLMTLCSLFCIETWRWRKWGGIMMVIIMLVVGGLGATHHRRMASLEEVHDVRIELWQNALNVIKERPLLGHGMSNAQEQFYAGVERYAGETFCQIWADQLSYVDAHNQYLQILMEFGCLGLLVLLTIYLMPVIIDNRHRLLSAYIMGLCMFQSIFDMFVMSSFCIIFCILVLMLLLMPEECCQKQDLCQHPS